MRELRRVAAALVALVAGCSAGAAPGHWPQWRGPARDNVSTETGLLPVWPAQGPPLSWEADGLGEGNASVAVAGGRVFTLGDLAGSEYAVALDERSGRLLWTACLGKIEQARSPSMRWLGQRTPTVDGDRLYAFRAEGEFVCLRSDDGRELWRVDTRTAFGARPHFWGLCDYPLAEGGRVILAVGGETPSLVALDREDGRACWRTLAPGPSAQYRGEYGASVVAEVGGVRQIVAPLRHGTFGFSAADGRLLWEFRSGYEGGSHPSTPMLLGDSVLIAARWQGGLSRVDLVAGGAEVCAVPRYSLKVRVGTFQDCAVALDGRVLLVGDQGILTCVDAATGEKAWGPVRARGSGALSLTCAGGRLYLLRADGTVTLASAGAGGLVEGSTFKIPGFRQTVGATNPVVAGGHLYVRDDQRLFRFDVREGSRPAAPRKVRLDLPAGSTTPAPARTVFVATPRDVVAKMLDLAALGKDDVLWDLGSGDGRILFAAASRGASAVGYEIDEDLVRISRASIQRAALGDWVRVEQGDLFGADLSTASVVAVYLPESFLERLKPQFARLKPGARIVSHQFLIPGVRPDRTLTVESPEDGALHAVHLWTLPFKE